MKLKICFVFFLLSIVIKSVAQDSKFSVGINSPIPFDHNFINKYYNGVVDLGIDYKLFSTKTLGLGLAFNAGLLKSDESVIDLKIKSYVIQPKLFIEFNIVKFHPFLRGGYSSMIFRTKERSEEIGGYYGVALSLNNTQSGLNINPGLKYNINDDFFVQAQYDHIYLGSEEPIRRTRYNNAVHIIKIGLGVCL
ncbi:outer membrane beta-barrel protein [Aestuariibaculum suncheonense]|uniref:Outer membrane beta-barrel protein n=1 Tax=Aestuariibaculum suncheonense TaxID=1028745 RepID=A0A8J6QIJ7_9FLAO|nr:outer membrane beta-barrel protein [Aestuariibaculum suncheonense]MBD0836988.1 outer membrane beta-barrel protein [Aestuariibaculum suncheonense]